MFKKKELAALNLRQPHTLGMCVVVASTSEEALKIGKRTSGPFTAISYDKLHKVKGTYIGAVLVDPPGDKVLIPAALLNALATVAAFAEVQAHTMIKVYRNGVEVNEPLYDSTRWWCSSCECLRLKAPCWKCGTSLGHHPTVEFEDLKLPSLSAMRAIANPLGWALAEHGSNEFDLNVVAVAWTEDARSIDALVESIAECMATPNGPTHVCEPTLQPHGRITYSIQLNGRYKLIELSIANGGSIK